MMSLTWAASTALSVTWFWGDPSGFSLGLLVFNLLAFVASIVRETP